MKNLRNKKKVPFSHEYLKAYAESYENQESKKSFLPSFSNLKKAMEVYARKYRSSFYTMYEI